MAIGRGSIDPGLFQWLTSMGISPIIGDIHFLVDPKSSYYAWLRDELNQEPSKIHFTLAGGYKALQAGRNDVLLVTPGDYVQTAKLTWAKDATAMIGVGPQNLAYQPLSLPKGQTRIYTTTTQVAALIEVTGASVTFANFGTSNNGNHAGNKADILLKARNFLGKNLSLRGGNSANQVANIGSGVPLVFADAANSGTAARFIDCTIGSSGNTTRTKGPGCVQFLAGAEAFGVHFKGCTFSTRTEVESADDVGLIQLAGASAVDRELYFKDCLFYNFEENWAASVDYAFRDKCTTTHTIVLDNCAKVGIDAWTDQSSRAVLLSTSDVLEAIEGIEV